MFCAAFRSKKLICSILTSKLAPNLVYHDLLSLALFLVLLIFKNWSGI